MSEADREPSLDEVRDEIAREIAAVHQESYGEGVHDVEVCLGGSSISVVMRIDLSPAEKTLIAGDRADAVKVHRETYQEAIGGTFVAIVERASGRRVSGFASRTFVEGSNPWSAEIFKLEPAAAAA